MRATHMVATVLGAGVLAAVLLWLTTSTVEAPMPHAAASNNPCSPGANTDRPLAPPAETNEPPDDGSEPLAGPPPQLIVNDPSKGRVWLRVVDADTGRPLANQRVELLPAGRVSASAYFYMEEEDHPRREPRATDGDGLIDFTAVVQEGDESDAEVIVEDLQNAANLIHVPVPDGWYPTIEPRELAEKLRTLLDKPTEDAIDFAVRRDASLSVNVSDYAGLPVAGALLALNLEPDDTVARDWVSFRGVPADIKIDDYLSYTPSLYTDLVPEQFRLSINGEVKYSEEHDLGQMAELGFHEPGADAIAGLVRGDVIAVAFHPLYGMVSGRLELQGGHNTIELRFPQATTGELHVQLNWLPEPEDPQSMITVRLLSSGPYGRTEEIDFAEEGADLRWTIPSGGAHTELIFTGIPAGWWQVAVEQPEPGAGAKVQLAAGEARELQLYLGAQAACEWTPIVNCDGEQMEPAAVLLIGGADDWRESREVSRNPEGDTSPVQLAPGDWIAVLPSLPPFRFTLQPGEKRQDVFDLKLVEVKFSISAELAQALNGDPGDATELELKPAGLWQGHKYFHGKLLARLKEADVAYDELVPGTSRNWRITPGEYEWCLKGDDELVGRLVVPRAGRMMVAFDLHLMPGYQTLDVELVGFSEDEPPKLTVEGLWDLRMEPGESELDRWMYFDDPSQIEHDLYGRLRTAKIKLSDRDYVVLAPKGDVVVNVAVGNKRRSFITSAPGKLVISAESFAETSNRDLWFVETLVNRDDPYADENYFDEDAGDITRLDYRIELIGESGWHRSQVEDGLEEVPPGRYSATVRRVEYRGDFDCTNLIATTTIDVGDGLNVVELSKLNYEAYASVDLVFVGRGSPHQDLDAWWFGESGPRAPMLIASYWRERVIELSWLSEHMPDGRLEFSFRNLLLPPGRYFLQPWPGATLDECEEFRLTPGENRVITIHGG